MSKPFGTLLKYLNSNAISSPFRRMPIRVNDSYNSFLFEGKCARESCKFDALCDDLINGRSCKYVPDLQATIARSRLICVSQRLATSVNNGIYLRVSLWIGRHSYDIDIVQTIICHKSTMVDRWCPLFLLITLSFYHPSLF